MKNLITIFIISLLGLFYLSFKKVSHQFVANGTTIKFEKQQGRFHGNYISYYSNGQKKSEGSFQNNMRAGTWSVWDSTGRLRISRKYENPFVFKRTFPKPPSDEVIKLLNIPRYTPTYNEQGVIELFPLQERMIVWLRRIWRDIDLENNPIIFDDNRLEKILHKNVFSGTVKAYGPETDTFKSILNPMDIDTTNQKVIRFRVKEELFFDSDRLISETRIIGICPVTINTITNDTMDLYWVYYPELRYQLAKEIIETSGVPKKIKSFDDLFFYRYFYGQISKASNVKDESIADYKSQEEIASEALRIDLKAIENEHDTWIYMSK